MLSFISHHSPPGLSHRDTLALVHSSSFPLLGSCPCPCSFLPFGKQTHEWSDLSSAVPSFFSTQAAQFLCQIPFRPIPVSKWTDLSALPVWLGSHHPNTANMEVRLSATVSVLNTGHLVSAQYKWIKICRQVLHPNYSSAWTLVGTLRPVLMPYTKNNHLLRTHLRCLSELLAWEGRKIRP